MAIVGSASLRAGLTSQKPFIWGLDGIFWEPRFILSGIPILAK